MSLKQAIEEAFAGVPYPGDDNITRCPYNCPECREMGDYFKGRTWTGHAVKDLRERHTALLLFTPEAFQYFLPAFMFAAISSSEHGHLIPGSIRSHSEQSQELMVHFAVRVT